MITCDVLGVGAANNGLGNQMFCIATTLALADRNNVQAVFPDLKLGHYQYYGETIFHNLDKGTDKSFLSYEYRERPYTSTIYNKIPFLDNMKIVGHFQSYKYFDCCKDLILDNFKISQEMENKIVNRYRVEVEGVTTSIHIRRGDYLNLIGHYEMLDSEYYSKALEHIGGVGTIFVFSDDIEWCEKNINLGEGKKIVFVKDQSDVEDLWLMTKMTNNVIANSTFSWWGAYLNQNENKKVVAPSKWFGPKRTKNNMLETKDLLPEKWIII